MTDERRYHIIGFYTDQVETVYKECVSKCIGDAMEAAYPGHALEKFREIDRINKDNGYPYTLNEDKDGFEFDLQGCTKVLAYNNSFQEVHAALKNHFDPDGKTESGRWKKLKALTNRPEKDKDGKLYRAMNLRNEKSHSTKSLKIEELLELSAILEEVISSLFPNATGKDGKKYLTILRNNVTKMRNMIEAQPELLSDLIGQEKSELIDYKLLTDNQKYDVDKNENKEIVIYTIDKEQTEKDLKYDFDHGFLTKGTNQGKTASAAPQPTVQNNASVIAQQSNSEPPIAFWMLLGKSGDNPAKYEITNWQIFFKKNKIGYIRSDFKDEYGYDILIEPQFQEAAEKLLANLRPKDEQKQPSIDSASPNATPKQAQATITPPNPASKQAPVNAVPPKIEQKQTPANPAPSKVEKADPLSAHESTAEKAVTAEGKNPPNTENKQAPMHSASPKAEQKQEPKRSKAKPLLIGVISAAALIALVLSVILIVSRNRSDEAKQNAGLSGDTNLSDYTSSQSGSSGSVTTQTQPPVASSSAQAQNDLGGGSTTVGSLGIDSSHVSDPAIFDYEDDIRVVMAMSPGVERRSNEIPDSVMQKGEFKVGNTWTVPRSQSFTDFYSYDTTIAVVSGKGIITAVSPGVTYIVAINVFNGSVANIEVFEVTISE